MRLFAGVFVLLLAVFAVVVAQTSFYEVSRESYLSNDYAKSINLLESEPAPNFSTYINLANAYYMQGNNAAALLNYRRAQMLQPRYAGINEQITLVKARANTLPRQSDQDNLGKSILAIANSFTVNELGLASLVLWLAIWGILIRHKLKNAQINLPYQAIIPLIMAFLAIGLLFSVRLYTTLGQPAAIVLQSSIVRSGPSADYPTLFVIDDASEIAITGQQEQWIQFQAEDGRIGWMQDAAIEKIN
ncbi:MAG: hypothetical protein CL607_15320 [Anaerolineaceae bacterium]|nr:hypothetical protein [Anaerolineaceae bacterium]